MIRLFWRARSGNPINNMLLVDKFNFQKRTDKFIIIEGMFFPISSRLDTNFESWSVKRITSKRGL